MCSRNESPVIFMTTNNIEIHEAINKCNRPK